MTTPDVHPTSRHRPKADARSTVARSGAAPMHRIAARLQPTSPMPTWRSVTADASWTTIRAATM